MKIFLLDIIHRKILLKTNRKNIFIIIIKNKDLLKITKIGISNLCIIGTDLNYNKKIKNHYCIKLKSLLYVNNNFYNTTKFFNIINYYCFKNFFLKFNGSLEFFLNFKKFGILDITETNKTLYENNFFPILLLTKINLIIVNNNFKKKLLNKIINKC